MGTEIVSVETVAIPASLASLRVPTSSLAPFPANPRRGDVAAIRASLVAHGQYRPLVVNERTREVLAGNHTFQAALDLGWEEIAVTYVDVDEDEAARIVLVDNRTNDVAGYDAAALALLLESLPSIDGTGYEPTDLDELLRELGRGLDGGADTDPVPLPDDPRTRPGDLYVLGEHRLLCGDSTGAAVAAVCDGMPVDVLWTDPPYGVDYVGKTDEALTLTGDKPDGLTALLDLAFAAVDELLVPGGRFYIAAPAGRQGTTFRLAIDRVGWQLRQTLVWAKDVFVLGHSDYHYQHEDVHYGVKPGEGRIGRGGAGWYGGNDATSVFAIERPKVSREHPTMKPVALVAMQLENSSQRGDVVLDPFAGAGSTLLACENLLRRCFAVELDPRYCDVIVDRWERHTGEQATKEHAHAAAV